MPLKSQIHTDKLLSQISVKYRNSEFIHDRVFPTLGVNKDSDLYRVYTRNLRIPETRRANRGVALEHDFHVTTNTYALERHALKDYVSDDDARNYDVGSLRSDATENLTEAIMRRMELTTANLFTTTSWSLNVSLAATQQWSSNTTTSNPIPIMDTGATEVIQNAGFRPNFCIVPRNSFISAKNHTSVLDRVKHTSKDMTEGMLAALFSLPEMLVPIAVQDTSAEGQADTVANIWGDNVFLGYKPPRPSPLAPSSGYMFKQARPMVKRFRVDERESEAIEVNINFQPKIVASLSGFLIRDTQA